FFQAEDGIRGYKVTGVQTCALPIFGTISAEDGRRLEQLGARPGAIEVTGDTRYDSVAERAERFDRTRDPFARLAIAPAGTFTIEIGRASCRAQRTNQGDTVTHKTI